MPNYRGPLFDRGMAEAEAMMARQTEAKASMRYAVLKVTKRRYQILSYNGASYMGDWQQGDGFWRHSMTVVEGCGSLSYSECEDKYRALVLALKPQEGQ